ncbi:MAG: apolipoprotein N-acyltransferase [Halobacteriovoraceae bacterium]|jgi:apolipoprotein N-acyltransferase|nr:apolipoprotein N-acyltransferase [Halobacteriovoraceae bacterium]
MSQTKTYVLLFIAAVLYTLGFSNIFNIYVPFLPLVATAIITFFIFQANSTKQRLIYYFFYNTIINIISFYWITNTFQEFGKLPFIIALGLNAGFALILNPHFLILIFALKLIDRNFKKLENHYFQSGIFAMILACLFTIAEYIVPQQFPVMLGQPWIIWSKYLGTAKYLGQHVFSFFSYLLAFEMIHFIKKKKMSYLNLSMILVFIVINPLLSTKTELKNPTEFNIRLVQANISNFLKVSSEGGGYASVSEVLSRYKTLSTAPYIEGKSIDLIVWPETAYPYPIKTTTADLSQTQVPYLFHEIISQTKAELLFGGYEHRSDANDHFYKSEFNASLLLSQEARLKDTYQKHILIPFGETLPLGPLNRWASKLLPEMAFFAEGEKSTLFQTPKKINFISSICYEILRPEFIRNYLNKTKIRPHIMINLTNDSWYGDTVEPELHLMLTKWRAIEFNLPILRATNTGISTYINQQGQEVKRLAYNKTGNLDLSLKLANKDTKLFSTFYQKYGFGGIFPLWLLFFIFHLILLKLRND